MFDVAPPEADDTGQSALDWYRDLVAVTALAVKHIVNEVDRNYRERRNTQFVGVQQGILIGYCTVIAQVYLEDDLSRHEVSDQLGRLVKTFGLVVYDPQPGPTQWWPMATRTLNDAQAAEIVQLAFHGDYPTIKQTR